MKPLHRRIALWALLLLMWQPVSWIEPTWPRPVALASISNEDTTDGSSAIPAKSVDTAVDATDQHLNDDNLEELVRHVPICIVTKQVWAGDLGQAMLYRIRRRKGYTVHVGYYAYWSTERPWGDNDLSRWLVPAMVVDAFYSHLLFVFPGLQRLLYGAGDVEGARIVFQWEEPNRLTPVAITADDESHREVTINTRDAVDEQGRVMLLNDVWSHQLGGRRPLALARAGAQRHCFSHDSLRPLTHDVVEAFQLGSPEHPRRAGPAWRI